MAKSLDDIIRENPPSRHRNFRGGRGNFRNDGFRRNFNNRGGGRDNFRQQNFRPRFERFGDDRRRPRMVMVVEEPILPRFRKPRGFRNFDNNREFGFNHMKVRSFFIFSEKR